MSKLLIETDKAQSIPVMKVTGRVDSETAPELDMALTSLLKDSGNKIVLDLKGVDFLSSAGLRAIVKAYQETRKAGGDVRLATASDPVEVVLRTVGMMDMLKIYPTSQEAVASF
jgi:anti-sigma B factor antagonist